MQIIYDSDIALRVDVFLSTTLSISRSQVNSLIKKHLVEINGNTITKSGILLKKYDEIIINKIETLDEREIIETNLKISRIYEDDDILVLNKPPHLVVHQGSGDRVVTLLDWLKENKIQLSNISGELKEGIVHRLDKQTSGAMVVAKNNATHEFLSNQLQNRTMGRIYLAIIDLPLKSDVIVECFLTRNPTNRLKISKTTKISVGKYSKSNFYKLLLSNDCKNELITAKLSTGRTHQIRAHLESISRHIIGDSLYGYKGNDCRIMLHSYLLFLQHPKLGRMSFQAELFDDMLSYLKTNFDMEKVNEILAHLASSTSY